MQDLLSTWRDQANMCRKECNWLAFFSNMKLLQLHRSYVLGDNNLQKCAESIVHEISVIFPNDLATRMSQCKFVEVM